MTLSSFKSDSKHLVTITQENVIQCFKNHQRKQEMSLMVTCSNHPTVTSSSSCKTHQTVKNRKRKMHLKIIFLQKFFHVHNTFHIKFGLCCHL